MIQYVMHSIFASMLLDIAKELERPSYWAVDHFKISHIHKMSHQQVNNDNGIL